MKLIKPSVELLIQGEGPQGMLKHIELAGRVCYKSEDKITEDSASKFVDGLIKSGHTSVLEHGTVNLTIPVNWETYFEENEYSPHREFIDTIYYDYYSQNIDSNGYLYVTTNYRRFLDLREKGFDYSPYMWGETGHFPKRYSFRIVCDRGVLAEFTRHRKLSYSVESTRYCNYSKDKFNNELTFIIPSWMEEDYDYESPCRPPEDAPEYKYYLLSRALEYCEEHYLNLLKNGSKPQEARQVLPMALKTEMIVTGFESDWKHFLSLRSPKAGAKGVHPDMAVKADKIYDILTTNGYISL